ncbi:DUF1129 domain-containing protein [Vagococcus entomophilus]|uniref:DUF1129 domain-containing protein n=1 Tax=Vagococcus entomophilus TaxID=1160095 RepID=A0A430AG04_9ENTE|nr:DUF1129 domain-containing protein [Vagococcus entomophilus]RSU06835.1 hypothetical protein CBF30_06085 [Vagococcus entomophilus]
MAVEEKNVTSVAPKESIEALEKQLTKRNEQYVFDLKKKLQESALNETTIKATVYEVVSVLVKEQKKGTTARQLFGTPSEYVSKLANRPAPVKANKLWEIWLDNSLLLLVFLAGMGGVINLISKTSQSVSSFGLITMILAAFSGGYVFYIMDKYVYRYARENIPKEKRPGLIKSTAIMMLILLAWFAVFSFAAFIPASINPQLDPVVNLILAGVTFGVRYLLKKRFGIQGTILRPN